jgi:hypothetical protein
MAAIVTTTQVARHLVASITLLVLACVPSDRCLFAQSQSVKPDPTLQAREGRYCQELGQSFLGTARYSRALEECLKLANKGDSEAAFAVGSAYEFGRGVVRSDKNAARWYLVAGQQNHPLAQAQLGQLYAVGIDGSPPNYVEAIKWLRKAADQDVRSAQEGLGWAYIDGAGGAVTRNPILAYFWIGLAYRDRRMPGGRWRDPPEDLQMLRQTMSPTQLSAAEKRIDDWLSSKK